MKKPYFLFALVCLMYLGSSANAPSDSFYVIGKDLLAKTIVAWSSDNGRLVRFKANDADVINIRQGDVIDVNLGLKKVSYLPKGARNYAIIQADKMEPVSILNILQLNGSVSIKDIIQKRLNTGPMGGRVAADSINTIVSIDMADVVGKVSAQTTSGQAFQFTVPAGIARNLNVGGRVHADPNNSFVVVQPANNQMYSYGYPIESSDADGTADEVVSEARWAITRIPSMKGLAGRMNLQFPAGVTKRIEFYTADGKYITSYSEISPAKVHNIAPGVYGVSLSYVRVMNVPIESGKETRIKAGLLEIVSNSWSLYDESGKQYYTSYNKPLKLALPVGNYKIMFGREFYPSVIVIKDGETVMVRE